MYLHYTLPFPLAIHFSVMTLHCQTLTQGPSISHTHTHSAIYNMRALHIKYISDKQHAPVKYWAHFSCTLFLAWKLSSMLLFLQNHSQMPWTLTWYFWYHLWSCCVSTSPSMTWKQHSCTLLHLLYQLYFKALMSSGQLYIISSELYLLNRCETDLLFHYSV